MEFTLGVLVGILLTLLILGASLLILQRRSIAPPLAPPQSFEGEPAVTVLMIESFLNQQLREALAAETVAEVTNSAQKAPRVKIKLNDATLDVQAGQHARFYAQLTATAWNLPVQLRPIADMVFGLQDGRVKINVTQVQLGGVRVPHALVDHFVSQVVAAAETKLNHSLTQLQRDTRAQLTRIETTEDLMILKFTAPRAAQTTASQGAPQ